MVPKGFRKTLCVIAGWVTLLEALVWGAASIFFVGVYGCSWDFFHVNKGANIWSMLYVTYFMGSCNGEGVALGFLFSPPSDPSRHLHIWMWIYTVVSVAWVPGCILLTVAASGEVRGRHGAYLYYPWITLTATLVVLDLIGAVYYFLDIFHTTTPNDYASFTANTSWVTLTLNSPSEGITTWLPSLFVTLFFCRFLVLWVINIFFLYGVYKGCNSVSLYTAKYLQSSIMPAENKKTWKDKFYQGPDPTMFDQRRNQNTTNEQITRANYITESRPGTPAADQQREWEKQEAPVRYKTDSFGIPVEEVSTSDGREACHQTKDRGPRSPLKPGVYEYSGHPIRSDLFTEQRHDSAPPIASGVQVPPELNKFEPFSYIAGDQPQRMKRPISRSNSRGNQPHIPRPDYTIAERGAVSLEYIPNRFRVPSPKRFQSQSNFNMDSSDVNRPLSSPKVGPAPPKKPTAYPRSIPENTGVTPQSLTSQQLSYYTCQPSAQNNNYNINRLY